MRPEIRSVLQRGTAIPASPLALTAARKLDERRQRALIRYYLASGVGGIAVGVHTTQFAIREVGLFKPVLQLVSEEVRKQERKSPSPVVRIGGICGKTPHAVKEAELLRGLGYDCGLLSLGALREATESELIVHAQEVGSVIPIMGFYLQPAVGGRVLPYSFWRRLAEVESVVAIKIAPFNRYQTTDVVRALAESGREEVALYTGNDDNIILDLLTPYRFQVNGKTVDRRIVGGLLGHWAVWTKRAVEIFEQCRALSQSSKDLPSHTLTLAAQVTDANAAFFDAAHHFAGCIAGLHEVLRRQGLLAGNWCLDAQEALSAGQNEEITRVAAAYPHLSDDNFVAEHLSEWLNG